MNDSPATKSAPPDYRGKTVGIEQDDGRIVRGEIVDQTETCVGVLLKGKGCRVVYVKIADLRPGDGE